MIRFEHVGLRYGVGPEVLSDINLHLELGSFHFLTGPSGAGKSSLLSLMYLGRLPTRGLLSMFGRTVNGMKREALAPLRQKIGVVFQDFRLLPHLSVFDNVALPLRIQRRPENEIKNHVEDILRWAGLGEKLQALPDTLSGGQQQRIAVARAVITRPQILLADEPTGNLDDAAGMRLLGLFDQLHKMGTTVIVATHNQDIVERFGYPQLVLENGGVRIEEPKNWLRKTMDGVF